MLTCFTGVGEFSPPCPFMIVRWIDGRNTVVFPDYAPEPPEIIGDSEDWLTAGLPWVTPPREIGGQVYGLGQGEV